MSKSVEERSAGATQITDHSEGVGEKLVFEDVSIFLIGVCREQPSGHDSKLKLPLEGAVYCVDNDDNTRTITFYTNDLGGSLPNAFASWCMCQWFVGFASKETKALLDRK